MPALLFFYTLPFGSIANDRLVSFSWQEFGLLPRPFSETIPKFWASHYLFGFFVRHLQSAAFSCTEGIPEPLTEYPPLRSLGPSGPAANSTARTVLIEK